MRDPNRLLGPEPSEYDWRKKDKYKRYPLMICFLWAWGVERKNRNELKPLGNLDWLPSF